MMIFEHIKEERPRQVGSGAYLFGSCGIGMQISSAQLSEKGHLILWEGKKSRLLVCVMAMVGKLNKLFCTIVRRVAW